MLLNSRPQLWYAQNGSIESLAYLRKQKTINSESGTHIIVKKEDKNCENEKQIFVKSVDKLLGQWNSNYCGNGKQIFVKMEDKYL